MHIQLDQELLNYKLYEDLLKLNKGSLTDLESSLEYSLSKLPKSVDYKIPAIEKLIECLKLNGEDGSENTVRVNKFRFNKLNGVILWH
jgi:tRNA G26 N,N-dimethylase Trm1